LRDKAIVKDLDLSNTTFTEALSAICLQTKTTYNIEEFAVVINPHSTNVKKAPPVIEMIQRRWLTPPTFLNFTTPPVGKIQDVEVSKLLEALGAPFPTSSSASYLSSSQTLIVRNTRASLDVIGRLPRNRRSDHLVLIQTRILDRPLLIS
jgi:hypothetical protein